MRQHGGGSWSTIWVQQSILVAGRHLVNGAQAAFSLTSFSWKSFQICIRSLCRLDTSAMPVWTCPHTGVGITCHRGDSGVMNRLGCFGDWLTFNRAVDASLRFASLFPRGAFARNGPRAWIFSARNWCSSQSIAGGLVLSCCIIGRFLFAHSIGSANRVQQAVFRLEVQLGYSSAMQRLWLLCI